MSSSAHIRTLIYICEWESLERRGQIASTLTLAARDIHVWRIDLPLIPQARTYARRRRLEILEMYADKAQISQDYSGRPVIDSSSLHVSTSYAEGIALLAVARRAVGVDVELQRKIAGADAIARSYFATAEYARWRSEQAPARQFLFYWTRKEAYLKALGLGFEHPPQSVDASFDIRSGEIFNALDAFESLRWAVRSLQLSNRYIAAVAHAREPGICYRWLSAASS